MGTEWPTRNYFVNAKQRVTYAPQRNKRAKMLRDVPHATAELFTNTRGDAWFAEY